MAEIRLENVVKKFEVSRGRKRRVDTLADRKVSAVDKLNFCIKDREFFTLVGPSGCGKSTALNLVAGLERATSGEIYFDKTPVGHLEPKERDVAMVFQSYALYPHMSVFENIAFPLRIRKTAKEKIREDVEKVSEVLGLTTLLSRSPKELSGGQRQRVALARALIRRPRAFLLDEPLSNLDARLRLEMRAEIKRIHDTWKITTVYVTHDQEEAMVLSDRIAVLRGGKVQQCATPLEVFNKPANRFVAEFVGNPPINIIDGELLAKIPEVARFIDSSFTRQVVCGIRPTDMRVSTENTQGLEGEFHFSAKVGFVEMTGSETWVDVMWEGSKLRAQASKGEEFKISDSVTIATKFSTIYVFNKESEERVEVYP